MAANPYGGLSDANRDIAVTLTNLFDSYGLGSLAPKILEFIKQGYSADTISILLQSTNEYKQRFAANEKRKADRLPVLSPAEYLATESSYRQIMSAAGLPPGFYDQTKDFEDFLAKDISPTELQSRVQDAQDVIYSGNQDVLNYAKQHYSIGDLVAYALDPNRAAPLIHKQLQAAQIGGAAAGQKIGVDTATAEKLAGMGITADQARQGFGIVADEEPTVNKLGDIYGDDVTQDDLVNQVFGSDNTATQKVKKLASKERASFGGSSGQSSSSLKKSTSGAF